MWREILSKEKNPNILDAIIPQNTSLFNSYQKIGLIFQVHACCEDMYKIKCLMYSFFKNP